MAWQADRPALQVLARSGAPLDRRDTPGARRLPFSNRVLVLTCMMFAFPYASYDYRLVLLYIPLGFVFLGCTPAGSCGPAARRRFACFAMLLLSPKAYEFSGLGVDFAVNAITLVSMIVLGLIRTAPPISPRPDDPLAA